MTQLKKVSPNEPEEIANETQMSWKDGNVSSFP